jgi:hypothetical protein
MEGKFDDNLILVSGGTEIEVSGPIHTWGDDELGASIDVSISQDDVTATGSTRDEIPRGASKFTLRAHVEGDGALAPGPASATGRAHARTQSGTQIYEWTVTVTLSESQPAANPANPPQTPVGVG